MERTVRADSNGRVAIALHAGTFGDGFVYVDPEFSVPPGAEDDLEVVFEGPVNPHPPGAALSQQELDHLIANGVDVPALIAEGMLPPSGGAPTDTTPPSTVATVTPATNNRGWSNSNVTIGLSASDATDGSGVSEIEFSLSGAQSGGGRLAGGSGSVHVSAEGTTTVNYFARDRAGNEEAHRALLVRIDKTPPHVQCGVPDGQWHATDVSLPCAAADSISGLANPAHTSFALSTHVAAGIETSDATSGSSQVCDAAGNCSTAGPIGGNKVDRKAPVITIATPSDGARYRLNGGVRTSYSCSDGGSGSARCTGSTPNGEKLLMSETGAMTFSVIATDGVGNSASAIAGYSVSYKVRLLYDPTRAIPSGSAYPIKLQLHDANGRNVSSPSVVLHAIGVLPAGTTANPPDVAGGSTPGMEFVYDSSLAGYVLNVETAGLARGWYNLNFRAGSDPIVHSALFAIK